MKDTNCLVILLTIFTALNLGFTPAKKSVLPVRQVLAIDSAREIRAIRKIAETYADSHVLGTGADQYVTAVHLITATEARVTLGERDEEKNDKNAYTLHFVKKKNGWKIFSVEYIFAPTGKRQIDTLQPPFPYPHWKKDLRGTG